MLNIYEKIAAIMQDVQYLAKDDHVKFGQTSYKALSEEKVTSIMRAELMKYKLVVFPVEQSASRSGNISHVDVKYRMVNVENPEEYIEIVSAGDGADTQDKGSGKAMTYAFKYMWLRTFALPTGEDPDKISSDELDAKAAQAMEQRQIICERCGRDVFPVKKRNGEIWRATDMEEYSKRKFGACLCADCMKLAQKEQDNAS